MDVKSELLKKSGHNAHVPITSLGYLDMYKVVSDRRDGLNNWHLKIGLAMTEVDFDFEFREKVLENSEVVFYNDGEFGLDRFAVVWGSDYWRLVSERFNEDLADDMYKVHQQMVYFTDLPVSLNDSECICEADNRTADDCLCGVAIMTIPN